MNDRIRINGVLYEAVGSAPDVRLPRKWVVAESDQLDDVTAYLFTNDTIGISVRTSNHADTGTTDISILAGEHYRDHIYDVSVDDIEPDYYGLCAAAEAGAIIFRGIVDELTPGKLFSLIQWGSHENTKEFVDAMKYQIDFEINKWSK